MFLHKSVKIMGKIGKERGFEYDLMFCLPSETTVAIKEKALPKDRVYGE